MTTFTSMRRDFLRGGSFGAAVADGRRSGKFLNPSKSLLIRHRTASQNSLPGRKERLPARGIVPRPTSTGRGSRSRATFRFAGQPDQRPKGAHVVGSADPEASHLPGRRHWRLKSTRHRSAVGFSPWQNEGPRSRRGLFDLNPTHTIRMPHSQQNDERESNFNPATK
jgi:hypothetical protein